MRKNPLSVANQVGDPHAWAPLEHSGMNHRFPRDLHRVLPHVSNAEDLHDVSIVHLGILRRIGQYCLERHVEGDSILPLQRIPLPERYYSVDQRAIDDCRREHPSC